MGLVDQDLFVDPRGATAKRLVELRARRVELQHKTREVRLAGDRARKDADAAEEAEARTEARALAFETDEGVKAAATAAGKARREAEKISEQEAVLVRAIGAIDDEILRLAREHADELVAEIVEEHEAARKRAVEALSELHQAVGVMRRVYSVAAVVHQAAGRSTQGLKDPATIETIVRNGGAGGLFQATSPVLSIDPPPAGFEELGPGAVAGSAAFAN